MCYVIFLYFMFFFFQAEDGIRDYKVTGVQTCALPICPTFKQRFWGNSERSRIGGIRRVEVHRDRDVMILDALEEDTKGIIFGCGFHGPASDAGDFPILVHGFDDSLETSGLFEEAEKRAQIEERRRGWRGHTNTSPPSTTIVCPVIKSLSDEARKTTVPSKSSGVSVRPRARSAIT